MLLKAAQGCSLLGFVQAFARTKVVETKPVPTASALRPISRVFIDIAPVVRGASPLDSFTGRSRHALLDMPRKLFELF
jgi:hypothetical protein